MKNKLCKNCKSLVTDFDVVEINTTRQEVSYKNGKLNIGKKIVVKKRKMFRCPTCFHKLFEEEKKALKWLNN